MLSSIVQTGLGCGSCNTNKGMGLGCNGCPHSHLHRLGNDGFDGLGDSTIYDATTGLPTIGYGDAGASTNFGSASFWENILGTGINKIAVPILNSQFGGPQPGQYFATGPGGQSVAYSLPAGSAASFSVSPFGSMASGSMMTWLLIGGAALFFFSMMSKH